MKHSMNQLRYLPLLLLLSGCLLMITASCGKDEPDWLVGYYLSINSQVRLTLTEEDEGQGTMPDKSVDVLSNTVRRMRNALQDAYPVNKRQGDDGAVIMAVDNIYKDYAASYADKEGHTICVVQLCRAHMDGDVVKESRAIKTYHFGELPQDSTSLGGM